ncbi:hypothetical protein [Propionimicrobium sp. PCR01-08-3]|uniref:hypothetical protein n=1 Tax=Propionimicrobium sp. PCR01-08-3 TaxID=3052086 RepID=UPI00255C4D4F|nr:hypothetical protein [Propionimicrobium sp. PCR01-08-3]WIY82576.1 hypothetical protein QQ658_13900 [Propionimicrobium sp. PCR01-08-3]
MTKSFDEEIRSAARHLDERTARAEQAYAVLEKEGQALKRADVQYRCPNRRGCILATVYRTSEGVLIHTNPYKFSPSVNTQSSNESGRARSTVDGDRHWKARTFFLDQGMNIQVTCDHLTARVRTNKQIEQDLKARKKVVIIHG